MKSELKSEQKQDEGFELDLVKRVYFVSFVGTPRNLAGFFGERTVGSRVLTLDFALDSDSAVARVVSVVNSLEKFRSCAIVGFKELAAY